MVRGREDYKYYTKTKTAASVFQVWYINVILYIQAITLSMCFTVHSVIGGNTHEWNRRGMQWA